MRYPSRQCVREGCKGRVSRGQVAKGFRYCSALCSAVDAELSKVVHAAKEGTDDPELVEQQYLALVEIADRISEWRGLVHAAVTRRGPK